VTEVSVTVSVEGAIATVAISNPPVNALSRAVLADIGSAFRKLDRDSAVRAVILRGQGRAFAAGGDVAELASVAAEDVTAYARAVQDDVRAIAFCGKPVIASVHGFALGGGTELALAADHRVATRDAKFGLPEVKLGLIPGTGATHRLGRLIGVSAASDLILSGRIIGADEALRIGLVDEVVDEADLEAATLMLASRFTEGGTSGDSVRAAKRLLRAGEEPALHAESDAFAALLLGPHAQIGLQAFAATGQLGNAVFDTA
jgi:enoyl-CoA hydratase/carnithine racemase